MGLGPDFNIGFLTLASADQSTFRASAHCGRRTVFRSSSMSMSCSSPITGRACSKGSSCAMSDQHTSVKPNYIQQHTSTQCSNSVTLLRASAHSIFTRARNGLSVIPTTEYGGSFTTIGDVVVGGAGWVAQETITDDITALEWILCSLVSKYNDSSWQ